MGDYGLVMYRSWGNFRVKRIRELLTFFGCRFLLGTCFSELGHIEPNVTLLTPWLSRGYYTKRTFMNFIWIAIAVLSFWSVLLTIFFWNLSSHYNSLLKGSTTKTLQSLLDSVLKDLEIAKKDIAMLQKQYATIEKEGRLHIQKVGLLRFNPFNDTGGDQSFILALVDGTDSGVVISGLYSRSGTRWYAKRVLNGRGVDHQLSEDEKKALQETKKIKPVV